jgi:hypothetical protein
LIFGDNLAAHGLFDGRTAADVTRATRRAHVRIPARPMDDSRRR